MVTDAVSESEAELEVVLLAGLGGDSSTDDTTYTLQYMYGMDYIIYSTTCSHVHVHVNSKVIN